MTRSCTGQPRERVSLPTRCPVRVNSIFSSNFSLVCNRPYILNLVRPSLAMRTFFEHDDCPVGGVTMGGLVELSVHAFDTIFPRGTSRMSASERVHRTLKRLASFFWIIKGSLFIASCARAFASSVASWRGCGVDVAVISLIFVIECDENGGPMFDSFGSRLKLAV